MLILIILYLASSCDGKTIHGVVEPYFPMQFLDRFCFQGDSSINYSMNDTLKGQLYLFSDEQWANSQAITHCLEKFKAYLYSSQFTAAAGSEVIRRRAKKPQYLNVVYGDRSACSDMLPRSQYVLYKMEIFNPDSGGHPFNHFSYEDSGLLSFFQLMVIAYVVVACTYGHRLWQTISKGGPMYMAIKMLMVTMIFQAASAGCMLLHLFCYSRDGEGTPMLSYLAIALDGLSHYQMMVMMVSLAVGLPSGASAVFDPKEEHLISNVVVAISIVQVVLVMWESTMAVAILRIMICIALAISIRRTVTKERSALRRDFYYKFGTDCYVWWLCYPVLSMLAVLLTEYMRKKFVVFGVTVGQSVAVVLLFRLFLSRSLYWEVSSLSSTTLPLRLEKSFGMKKYSS